MASENLYQRRGVYWIRYMASGRLIRRSLQTDSLHEAKRMRREILGGKEIADQVRSKFGLAAAPIAGAPQPTVAEVVVRYIAHREAKGGLRDNTRGQERGMLNNWVVPELGSRRIGDVTMEDVDRFIGLLRRSKGKKGGRPLGAGQVRAIFDAAFRVFRYALRHRLYVGANPCDVEERPEQARSRDHYLTAEQGGALLGELEGRMRDMVELALHTGLRWGEVCGLAWKDLDLGEGAPAMSVRRSFQGPTKNAASAATVPLSDHAAALLRRLEKTASSPWVFTHSRGKPYRRMSGYDRDKLAAAAERAGVRGRFTPHVARHTFGTLLYGATTDPKAVQRLMRHSNIKTTLSVYVTDERDLTGAVNRLPAMAPRRRLRSV